MSKEKPLQLSGHVERIFVHKNWREDNIWFQPDGATCHTVEATLDVGRPVFEDRIMSHRADVVWPPRSCDLTPLDYYLWGAVKDKCYADKPATIDALKDNIREAIGLKNWIHRLGILSVIWTDILSIAVP